MSTHANVGFLSKSGNLDYVYVHSDGYLSYTGRMLLEHYNTPQLAKALVQLGDLSIVKERLAPDDGEAHGYEYEKRAPNVTVAYHRDRREPLNISREKTNGSLSDAFAKMLCADRQYIFVEAEQKWYFFLNSRSYLRGPDCPMPLEGAIAIDNENW